jgi:hypothetical protein
MSLENSMLSEMSPSQMEKDCMRYLHEVSITLKLRDRENSNGHWQLGGGGNRE